MSNVAQTQPTVPTNAPTSLALGTAESMMRIASVRRQGGRGGLWMTTWKQDFFCFVPLPALPASAPPSLRPRGRRVAWPPKPPCSDEHPLAIALFKSRRRIGKTGYHPARVDLAERRGMIGAGDGFLRPAISPGWVIRV